MGLVERDTQLALLESLVVNGGKGSVALVSGPVACGKTALLGELSERAARSGAITMFATGSQAEQDLPFGVVGQFSQLTEADTDVMQVARAVGTAVLAQAKQAPVLVVVDDAQYCDAESMHCLLYVIRRLHSSAVTVVFASSTGIAPEFEAELLRQPRCHRVTVGPLSKLAVTELLGDAAPDDCGNPLVVSTVATGGDYSLAVRNCLQRGGPLMVSVANGLAILGDRTPTDQLARLVSADVESVAAVRSALVSCGLPAFHSIVLSAMPSRTLTRLRWQAGALLHADGASVTEVASQLLAAPDGHESWAAGVLTEAAEAALRAEDLPLAASCLELAARCGARVGSLLARVNWRLDPGTPSLGSLTGASLIGQLLWHGRHEQAVAAINERLGDDLRLVGLWLTSTHPGLLNSVPAELCPPGGWLANLKSVTFDQRMQSAAVLAQVLTGRADDTAALGAEHVLQRSRLGERALESPLYEFSALLALIYAGRLKAASYWCERSLADVGAGSGSTAKALLLCVRAEIALRQGDLVAAHSFATAALGVLPTCSWGVAVGLPLSIVLLTLAGLGRAEEALSQADRPLPPGMFQTRYGLGFLYARGQLGLALGRPHAALADFLSCGDLMQEWGIDQPAFIPWRTGAAQSWLALRHPAKARRLAETQLSMVGSQHPRVRGISLRVLASASDSTARIRLLHEASELLDACGDKFELSLVLNELGSRPPVAEEPRMLSSIAVLSEAERRVAAPAAQGFTNREIAGKLFITVSTVEQHLTRVYRKLNVKHRRELPAELCAS